MWKSRKIRFALLLVFLAVVCAAAAAPAARAQCTYTQVSATIIDPNGYPYSYGQVTYAITPSTSSPTCNGLPFNGNPQTTQLDVNGSFSVQLAQNSAISPSGTKWTFSVNGFAGIPAPVGLGSQFWSITPQSLTTSTLNLTSTFDAAATALVRISNQGNVLGTPNQIDVTGNVVSLDANIIFPGTLTTSLASSVYRPPALETDTPTDSYSDTVIALGVNGGRMLFGYTGGYGGQQGSLLALDQNKAIYNSVGCTGSLFPNAWTVGCTQLDVLDSSGFGVGTVPGAASTQPFNVTPAGTVTAVGYVATGVSGNSGYDALNGGTAFPTVIPNTAGWGGPPSASFTSYVLQLPATGPTNSLPLLSCGTPSSSISPCTFVAAGGSGTVTSVGLSMPSWLTVTNSPVTTSGTLTAAPTTAQTSHQVIGTCGSATTFAPCTLVAGDIPTGIPIANVGSAGLSATAPLGITSAGVIFTTSLTGFRYGNAASADTVGTAAQAATLIQGLTGCNTATYVFTPQASDCVAPAAGSNAWSSLTPGTNTSNGFILSAAGTASTPSLDITGAPYAGTNANSFGTLDLTSGSAAAIATLNTAGTYFTIRQPTGGTSDFVNWFTGVNSEFKVTYAGVVTIGNSFTAGGAIQAGSSIAAQGNGAFQLTTNNMTNATSGTCSVSGAIQSLGRYWNGSASAVDTIAFTPTCASGTNGAETLTLANTGSTGLFTFAITGTETNTGLTSTGAVTFSGLTNAATGDYVCYNAGVIEYNTATCTLSLARYKTDIETLTGSLDEVMQLRPVEYRYRPELHLGGRLQVGFVADAVEQVDPRIAVYKNNGELESVDYEHVTALDTAAIQEMQQEIIELKKEVVALKEKVKQ